MYFLLKTKRRYYIPSRSHFDSNRRSIRYYLKDIISIRYYRKERKFEGENIYLLNFHQIFISSQLLTPTYTKCHMIEHHRYVLVAFLCISRISTRIYISRGPQTRWRCRIVSMDDPFDVSATWSASCRNYTRDRIKHARRVCDRHLRFALVAFYILFNSYRDVSARKTRSRFEALDDWRNRYLYLEKA